jgi:hypothetical protein
MQNKAYKFMLCSMRKNKYTDKKITIGNMDSMIDLALFLFSIKYFISHLNNQAGTSERYCCGGV